MKWHQYNKLLLSACIGASSPVQSALEPPRITCVVIIDQGSARIINDCLPHSTGALAWIAERATRYMDAHQPHSAPTTAPGHATLSTGALAREHGIVGNSWYDIDGTIVKAEYDAQKNPTTKYLMVDTLADQASLISSPADPIKLINLSLKSRAALMMAGHTQTAWWYDEKKHRFAGIREVPAWLAPISLTEAQYADTEWQLRYPKDSPWYRFVDPYSYTASCEPSLIGTRCSDEECLKTPRAQRMLINALRSGIATWSKEESGSLLATISLSGLDKVGHTYGPASYEAYDLVAWLDHDLMPLLTEIEAASNGNFCIVLTADHGAQPIPEVTKHHGYGPAQRITPASILERGNGAITKLQPPFLYTNNQADAEEALRTIPGILTAQSTTDCDASAPIIGSINHGFRALIYPGRVGDTIATRAPYTLISEEQCGTKHNSPFNYDTHIPIWIAAPGSFDKKTVLERVYAHQLAPTLAQLLEIPRPSACRAAPLPH